jgi:endoglucanase
MERLLGLCRRYGMVCAGAALLAGLAAGAAVAQTWWSMVQPRGAAPVTSQAYFPTRQCINMGSGLEAPREGEWGYTFRQRDLATVRAAGFDTIRIPIKWSAHAATRPPYAIDPAFRARVDQIVTWALEAGLNVIINVHHYDELYENPDVHEPRLEAIWAQLATWYRTAPPGVMFEIINEPRGAFSGQRVNDTQDRVLQIIRRTNPTRTVILTGDEWGGLPGMDNLRLPADPYVVATVHSYGPFEFTHQGAEWLPNAPPPGRTWPLPGDLQTMDQEVASVARWRRELGVPVLLGEYGVDTAVPLQLRAAWTRDMAQALNRHGIPGCYFNFAGGFGIYDTRQEAWIRPVLDGLGLGGTSLRPRQ